MNIRQSKFFTFLFAGLTLFIFSCQKDQVDEVPESIRATFEKDYPTAVDHSWSLKENTYEVDFYLDNKDMEAEYNHAGERVEVEIMMNPEDLPQPIKDYLDEHYPMVFVAEASLESRPDKSIYEVEIKSGLFKSKDLQFDMDGNLISDDSFKR